MVTDFPTFVCLTIKERIWEELQNTEETITDTSVK